MSDPQQPTPSDRARAGPGPGPGLEFGGPGARLVGYIVDQLIVVAAIFALFIVFGLLAGDPADPRGDRASSCRS